MKKSSYLISGSSSGLGKYLCEQLGGTSFNRTGTNVNKTDIIIHAAFNRAREVSSKNLYRYLVDNIFLTQKITQIPHKKFIYISSVDVYPKDKKKHSEDEIINIDQASDIYALTKIMSESLIQNLCKNFLILRCSSFLGPDAKENSLIKIIKEENPAVTLSPKSELNFVLHRDVLEFVKLGIEKDLRGIYNIVVSENITLLKVGELLGKKVTFGTYRYSVGNIDNTKVSKLLPSFKKTSEEVINEFRKLI